MNTEPLAQYGAVGVILTLLLGLFIWAFKRLFDRLIVHFDSFTLFMQESNRRDDAHHQALMDRFDDFFRVLANNWLEEKSSSHHKKP